MHLWTSVTDVRILRAALGVFFMPLRIQGSAVHYHACIETVWVALVSGEISVCMLFLISALCRAGHMYVVTIMAFGAHRQCGFTFPPHWLYYLAQLFNLRETFYHSWYLLESVIHSSNAFWTLDICQVMGKTGMVPTVHKPMIQQLRSQTAVASHVVWPALSDGNTVPITM